MAAKAAASRAHATTSPRQRLRASSAFMMVKRHHSPLSAARPAHIYIDWFATRALLGHQRFPCLNIAWQTPEKRQKKWRRGCLYMVWRAARISWRRGASCHLLAHIISWFAVHAYRRANEQTARAAGEAAFRYMFCFACAGMRGYTSTAATTSSRGVAWANIVATRAGCPWRMATRQRAISP